MTRGLLTTALVLALLAAALLGCSSGEQDEVLASSPPTTTPTPTPTLPSDPTLVRYVSPSGDDHNAGTFKHPWRTLTMAFARLYGGQVLLVRGGTYHEQIEHVRLHVGSPQKPITVLAYPGENPVLAGSISLSRPAFWHIDNLDVTGDPHAGKQPTFMVKVVGGHAWSWRDSEFSGTLGQANVLITGWNVGEPSGFTFSGNCLHGLPKPPQGSTNLFLGSMNTGAYGTVSRNVIFNDNDQPNVRVGSGAGAPSRVKLVKNTIYGGTLGIDVRDRPFKVRIRQNIVGGGTAPAMIRFHGGQPVGTSVENNVAVDAQQLFRPEVEKNVNLIGGKHVHIYGNVVLSEDPMFVDTTRCDGFRPDLDALAPYGAVTP